MRRAPAAALLFGLSASVLILEILAARLMAPYVGLSLETYTGIIGVVLAGIATGHAVGGRLADAFPWRAVLGPCVLAGGLLAGVTVPVVSTLGAALGGATIPAVVVLAIAGFFLPTAALSAASPIITKAQLHDMSESGRVVGSLSAWSTAGALVGTFLTGFVLVATLPTTRILYLTSMAVSVLGIVLTARGRWSRAAGVVLLLVTGVGVVAVESDLCLEETRYYCVRVREARDDAAARVLRLDTLSHSYVDLDDRGRLGFRYQRVVAAAIDERHPEGAPVDVLHVGGGGYAFPRFVAATRPGSVNRVLELDEGLLDIATSYLDLDPDAVSARAGDARTALADEPPGAYDFVVADTFGSLDPPWHLATAETAELVRRLLRAGGVYAVNIVDAGPRDFVRAEAATLRTVFEHVVVAEAPDARNERPENTVLFASDAPIVPRPAPEDGLVLDEGATARFSAGALVLRDDFAPVQRLITRVRA